MRCNLDQEWEICVVIWTRSGKYACHSLPKVANMHPILSKNYITILFTFYITNIKNYTFYIINIKSPLGWEKARPKNIVNCKRDRSEIDAPIEVCNIFGPLGVNPVRVPSFLGGYTTLITIYYNTPAIVWYLHVEPQYLFIYLFHNMLGNTINKYEITRSNNNIAESIARPHLSQSF